MSGGHHPAVSIVVPVYNQAHVLPRTVPSLIRQEGISEIIWVDDGSSDGSAELIERLASQHGRARVLRHSRNRGRGAARNTGLAQASGEVILFMDADIIAEAGLVQAHAARYSDEGVLGVLSRDVPLDLDPEQPYHRYLLTATGPRHFAPDRSLPIKYCIIGYTSIRADALRAVGGFDETIDYGEDLDLAYRLSRLGGGAFVREPRAVVYQLGLGDLNERVDKLRTFGANLRRLAVKHPGLLRRADLGFVASPLWSAGVLPRSLIRLAIDAAPRPLQLVLIRYLLAAAVASGYREGARQSDD
jgi:mycofactocin glycosyltransferase